MDSQLVQRTRYQLQVRVRTAKTCPTALFPTSCLHLVDWIDSHSLLKHLLDPVRPHVADFDRRLVENLAKDHTPQVNEITGPWRTGTRTEAVALAWAVLRLMSRLDFADDESGDQWKAYLVAYMLTGEGKGRDTAEVVERVRDVAVQSVYDFIDEEIDSRNVVLGLLLKYKTRCEWYRRDRLRAAAADGLEGRVGERALAFDLYEYLHDQGVDFAIESVTASGEPDLIASSVGGMRLVADAKYVCDDGKLAETVAAGFRQVVRYCTDTNEPVGYLVAFVDCGVTLDLKAERDDGFPCFRLGGITVYYVVVDIRERSKTASKLPKPRVVEVPYERLVSLVEAAT